MKFRLLIIVLIGGLLTVLTSCTKDDSNPDEKKNPFEMELGWNGFIMDETEFETPNAIIEFYGENLDSLTSNYDVSFTDGTFDPAYRIITNYTIFVYFDVNSPSLAELSSGIYYYENTPDREPNIINSAYIIVSTETSVIKYPVIEGTVKVSALDGYFLIEYLLKTVKDQKIIDVAGQYTGLFQFIDQTLR